ncbi:MAG: RNA polymerase-associated protein RapA [Dehalococcoidia bacterium]|nr:RNA polymerase-associated protein RapA [Bacillota bacterium]
MKFMPHDYQQYAINYLLEKPVAALFLDCGLGKTVIALTAIKDLLFDSFEVHKILIIAPFRVARDVWPAEIEKWNHLHGLTYSVATGTEVERKAALNTKADIYIINRENVDWLVNKSDTVFDFDMIVIDELSSFKSHQTKRFKALMKVRPKIKRIIGLTGTPASNGLMDLWSEFRLLDLGKRLGKSIGQYREAYFTPDKRNHQVIFSYKPLPNVEKHIYDKIADITISMKSVDHIKMPELLCTAYPVHLSDNERKRYDELRQDLVLPLSRGEITAANAAVLAGKLCQMANGAVYTDGGEVQHIHDRKLDALEDLIEAANGKPVLVVYWFRHDLDRIQKRYPAEKLDSTDSIKRWNAGEIPIAVVHPASAGHGLNLQDGGACLIWFGLTWSLELYQQTNARLWRQGQKDTVVIQHIVTKGTIDEQVIAALKRKDKTQTALIEAVKAILIDN